MVPVRIGTISEVHGAVVVIQCDSLPPIRRALQTGGTERYLFEVHQHLDPTHVRAITLHRSAGLGHCTTRSRTPRRAPAPMATIPSGLPCCHRSGNRRVVRLERATRHLEARWEELGRLANALRQEEIIEEIEVILLSAEQVEQVAAPAAYSAPSVADA